MITMAFKKRRSKALTNYKKRIALLKSGSTRLVVRKSNRQITLQLVGYEPNGDKIKAAAYSSELSSLGWLPKCNIPTAYLTGMLLAKKAQKAGFSGECILDIGLYKPISGNVVFSAAKGFVDGGMSLKSNIEMDENRISGKHIMQYAVEGSAKKGHSEFSEYEKAKINVKELDKLFESVKKKINSE